MKLIRTEDAVGHVLCHDLTQIIKDQYKDARFRKGHVVTAADIPVLLSMGKLTAEDLKLGVDIYNPKKFYKETRDKWLSLSVDK